MESKWKNLVKLFPHESKWSQCVCFRFVLRKCNLKRMLPFLNLSRLSRSPSKLLVFPLMQWSSKCQTFSRYLQWVSNFILFSRNNRWIIHKSIMPSMGIFLGCCFGLLFGFLRLCIPKFHSTSITYLHHQD